MWFRRRTLARRSLCLSDREFNPELLKTVPASTARMYQCLPVEASGNVVKVAFVDPLNPQRADELGFVIRKDVHMVVADPGQIEKAIERYYGGWTTRAFRTFSGEPGSGLWE